MIRVASDNDVLVPTKGVFEFKTHLIVQDILPRFIRDKLGMRTTCSGPLAIEDRASLDKMPSIGVFPAVSPLLRLRT